MKYMIPPRLLPVTVTHGVKQRDMTSHEAGSSRGGLGAAASRSSGGRDDFEVRRPAQPVKRARKEKEYFPREPRGGEVGRLRQREAESSPRTCFSGGMSSVQYSREVEAWVRGPERQCDK